MQIKKGQQFKCIKTVIMDDEEDSEAYIQGKTYISDIDGCITNKMGDKHHSWISDGYDSFVPYKSVEDDLKRVGFDVIVFVPSYDEDNGMITCGNAILSGKLPTSKYKVIKTK